MKNLAIYIHWPFCKAKCPYCDFNSHVRDNIQEEIWRNSYLKELDFWRDFLKDKNITSVFFGGGTPSLMPVKIVSDILAKLNNLARFDEKIEITLEANPTSSESSKFSELAISGINRISVGIQSLNLNNLKFLGREHNVEEALNTLTLADKYFSNYSFDLIYGLPNQTLENWEKELTEALNLAKYHISLYQLTIEKGTKFYQDFNKGKFTMPDSDFQASIYKLTNKISKNFGFECYEISNYAKRDFQSKHNLSYWQYENYLGFGAGAHSRITKDDNIYSLMNFHNPEKWLDQVNKNGNALQQEILLDKIEAAREYIMMSLRLKKGLNKEKFEHKIGFNLDKMISESKIDRLRKGRFLINSPKYLSLTPKGQLLLNQLLKYLI